MSARFTNKSRSYSLGEKRVILAPIQGSRILLELSPFRPWKRLAVNLQVREKTSHLKIAFEGKTHVQDHLLRKINGLFKFAAHLPCLYSYEKGPSSSFCNLLNLVSWVLSLECLFDLSIAKELLKAILVIQESAVMMPRIWGGHAGWL